MTDPQSQPPNNPIQPSSQPDTSSFPEQLKAFTMPLSRRGWPKWLVFLMAVIGFIYILNPTLGIFELIPDNLPLIGNLDEGVAFILMWFGLVEFFEGKKPNSVSNS